jgi:hypothetical protein
MNDELKKLVNEWLNTLETRQDNWEGVIASDQEIARDFLIEGQPDAIPFLDWLEDQGVKITVLRLNKQQLHNELRAVWTLVSDRPGISLRDIGCELGYGSSKAKKLVDKLIKSRTLTREPGKMGTLRATVPMINQKSK